jgi:hypothetical protein
VGGGVNFTVPVTIGENPIVTSVLIFMLLSMNRPLFVDIFQGVLYSSSASRI